MNECFFDFTNIHGLEKIFLGSGGIPKQFEDDNNLLKKLKVYLL